MEETTQEHFGLGVFAFDAAHIIGACCLGVDVGHRAKVGGLGIGN